MPRSAVEWLLEDGRYRFLPRTAFMRQLGTALLALRGEPATREHVRHILAITISATRDALKRKLTPAAGRAS